MEAEQQQNQSKSKEYTQPEKLQTTQDNNSSAPIKETTDITNLFENEMWLRATSTIPTGLPRHPLDKQRLYVNGSTVRLYVYDTMNATWKVAGDGIFSPTNSHYIYEDFIGGNDSNGTIGTNGWSIINNSGNATFSGQDGEVGRPGIFEITMVTTTNDNGTIYCAKSTGTRTDQPNLTMEASLKLANVSDVYCSVGITMTPGGDDVTGVYFKLDTAVDGKWYGYTRNNTFATATPTGVTATTNWTKFKFVSNSSATSWEFFIDDVSIGTVTNPLPTQKAYPHIMLGIRSTTAKSVKIDYYHLKIDSLSR